MAVKKEVGVLFIENRTKFLSRRWTMDVGR